MSNLTEEAKGATLLLLLEEVEEEEEEEEDELIIERRELRSITEEGRPKLRRKE